jgi:hypothetical protein
LAETTRDVLPIERAKKETIAKSLLKTNLGEPDGVVSRKVKELTDVELERVFLVGTEPIRLRKQLLKHIMTDVVTRQQKKSTVADKQSPPEEPAE